MAIEIVSFPIKNGGSFHSYVNVYQRVIILEHLKSIPLSPLIIWDSEGDVMSYE